MSPTSDRSPAAAGFTLMELMIVMTLLAIISLGVITAYLFMARNLERLAMNQGQDVAARRLLWRFTRDVGAANGFTSYTAANLTFTVPRPLKTCVTTSGSTTVTCDSTTGLAAGYAVTGPDIPSGATVASVTNATTFRLSANANATNASAILYVAGVNSTISYVYTSGNNTLTRTDSSGSTNILTNIDPSATNTFIYYDESATVLSLPLASAAGVKHIGFSFSTKAGSSAVGTQSSYVILAPRVALRNWHPTQP